MELVAKLEGRKAIHPNYIRKGSCFDLFKYNSPIRWGIAFRKYSTQSVISEEERKFNKLASKWKSETAGTSSPLKIRMNRNYQKIISEGRPMIKYILRDLQREPRDWFWALEVLVTEEENPTTEEMGFNDSVEAWIAWGRDRNLI